MILVTGGIASGKRTYVSSLGYAPDDFAQATLDERPVVFDAQELVRDIGDQDAAYDELVDRLAGKSVVICTEVGAGIVPLDKGERFFRERAGRLAAMLATRADAVVYMVCGIPNVVKGDVECAFTDAQGAAAVDASDEQENRQGTSRLGDSPYLRAVERHGTPSNDALFADLADNEIELVIMRHGQTPGNSKRQYVGIIDHPLSEQGRAEALAAGVYPQVTKVYVTPLKRTHETASICFPNAEQVVVDGLQEMNFGDFAGKSAADMVDDEAYRAWVDSYCEGPIPNGESQAEFTKRICQALARLIHQALARGEKRIILVAHGGTLMASLSTYARNADDKGYFDWHVGNCQGYRIRAKLTKGGTLVFVTVEQFESLDFLN